MKISKFLSLFLFLLSTFVLAHCASYNRLDKSKSTPTKTEDSAVNQETKLREQVTQFAQKHIGTKYKYAGKNPAGFDCSGFTYFVMQDAGITLNASSKSQESNGKKIEVKDTQPGDLLFFRRSKNGDVFHVSMVLSNENGTIKMIHSTTSRGVVIDELNKNTYWNTKVATARNVISSH